MNNGAMGLFVGWKDGEKRVVDRSQGRRLDRLVNTVEEIGWVVQ